MENELKARITADISNFTAGMAKVESNLTRAEAIFAKSAKSVFQIENALSKLSKQYKEGSISEAQFTKQADELSKSLIAQRDNMAAASREVDRLKKSLSAQTIKPAVQEIKNLGTSVAQTGGQIRGANTVALEFNRIIQDAPFGIIGVGNNIQQLTANFANLSKNAGGTVPAIKAAFSALVTGPNIALLAVSAITTALTVFQMGLFKSKDEAKTLTEELEKYRDTLNQITRAQIEGEASAAKETQSLALLRAQAENLSVSDKDRLEAVKELQRLYPETLSNLTQEQILTGNVGDAYEKLSKTILETAKARAFSSEIENNFKDILTLQNKETEIQIELEEKRAKLEAARAAASSAQGATQTSLLFQQNRIQDQINNLLEDEVKNRAEIEKLNGVNAQLAGEITKSVEAGARFTKETAIATGQAAKSAKELKDNFESVFAIDPAELSKRISKAVGNVKTSEIENIKIKVDLPVEEVADDISEITAEIEKLELGFQRLLERNSLGILTQTAGAFGNEIVKSFETGNAVLDTFIRNLIRSTPIIISEYLKLRAAKRAQVLASLGDNATEAAGEGISLATKAANALGPFGLAILPIFIAGALGIISGAFTKAKSGGGGGGTAQSFGNLPGREFGGPVSKGQAYIVGEKRPEIFVPSTSGIIIPQMPKSGGVSTGSGGTMKIEVEVKGRIDGEVIRLSNKRAGTRVRNT